MKRIVTINELKAQYYFKDTFSYAMGPLRINLGPQGKFYVASCPFHQDTTPSFYLYNKNGINRFKCFSTKCEIGSWDIFALIQDLVGCNFIEAVKRFGQHVNVNEVIIPRGKRIVI